MSRLLGRNFRREPCGGLVDRTRLSDFGASLESPLGEIDIIAARRHTLIFVEVKARAKLDDAAEAVTERQKQRIAAAGENDPLSA